MTQQDYFVELEKILDYIRNEQLELAEVRLKELYEYKPVRLKWFVYKAELLTKQKRFREANELLRGKFYAQYNYDGMEELYRYYERFSCETNNQDEYERNKYYIESLLQASGENNDVLFVEKYDADLKESMKNYLENQGNGLEKIIRNSYITYNLILYIIINECYRQDEGKTIVNEQWLKSVKDVGYLLERLEVGEEDTFLLIGNTDNDILQLAVIRTVLEQKGKKVIYYENRGEITEKLQREILKLSLQKENGKLLTVIASGSVLNALSMSPLLDKNFSKFDIGIPDFFDCSLSFAWMGDYCTYIEKIYNCNIMQLIDRKSECRYSIVIPARNSINTLQHTLRTCLEIPYEDYEIVISDNSTNNNSEIYELCRSFNDSKIRYYRTPRSLRLTKSFEYAILQSRGEFIIPIGSDDGVLPWIFETLDCIRSKYPNEMIIQWDRGFYAWKGFNGGQQNEFRIPRKYSKNNYKIYYEERVKYISNVLTNPDNMYGLPLLYINSGFKREYLKVLLQKTGRLWDGICQDLYMGVVNVAINQKIINLQYPLTIAGMSSGSEGAKANEGLKSEKASCSFNDEVRKNENVGGFSMSSIERLLPELRTDRSSLFNSFLRAVDMGVLSREYLRQVFDWKMMFLQIFLYLDISDVEFDRKIHYARYVASWHGEMFLKWFDDTLYNVLLEPQKQENAVSEIVATARNYNVGTNFEGGVTLDAAEYQVENIYDAVRLFCKLSEL